MKNTRPIFILSVLSIAAIVTPAFNFSSKSGPFLYSRTGSEMKEIKIGEKKIMAEMVSTPEERTRGLSGRYELCPDCGMLFVFEKPDEYSFWMKDMRFDLDIVWISNGEISGIEKNVSRERGSLMIVRPEVAVDKILEVNAGTSGRLGLKIGDKLIFN